MRVDGGFSGRLVDVVDAAKALERQGYCTAWSAEVNHDPFLPLALAAEHTSRLELGTGIAVAFARNPMTVASTSWDLQAYSQGRFLLGLGTQIRPHIEKRFSMPWGQPVSRMREFVAALRAIWSSWQDGAKLDFDGQFYTHKIMTPMFVPENHAYGFPKIFIAAVGEAMTRLCGEVADGMLCHAFTTARYLQEVTTPALMHGIERADRSRDDIELSCPVFAVTGKNEAELSASASAIRQQLAFYGSTPAYRPVLELHGWGDLQTQLRELSLGGQWETMGGLIDDDVLDAFAVVAPLAALADKVVDRYGGIADRIMLNLPAGTAEEDIAAVVTDVQKLAR